MQPEGVMPGSPRDWLRIARSDLALATAQPPAGVLLECLCFHAQQAAEKALKALLISRNAAFPKTHSLRMLLDLAGQFSPVPAEVERAAILTDYAVTGRYPGDFEPVEEGEYREAVRLAEQVVAWVERMIADPDGG